MTAFARAAAETAASGGAASSGALPTLAPGASPLAWVDDLGAPECGLRAFKHRKLLERIPQPGGGAHSALVSALQWLHDDARVPGNAAAVAAGSAAALRVTASPAYLDVVHHAFSTQQPPPKAKPVMQ